MQSVDVGDSLNEMTDILLAYSGGIDSHAAVEILRQQGYRVQLVTLDLTGDKTTLEAAREGAKRAGAELHIIDAKERFEQEIIDYFASEYRAGRTPAPCTRCNTHIKWELLRQKGDEMGIYHLATGHYFRVEQHNSHTYVSRAVDPRKDQSYYLWGVKEEILRRAVTPMGEQIKAQIKEQSDFKRESMGICFLHGRHYTELLDTRYGRASIGEIIDHQGQIIAQHNGITRYTIGQRRGEGIPEGLRVTGISAERNEIRVGLNEELYTQEIEIDECHFIDPEEVVKSTDLNIMVRGIGRNPKGRATLSLTTSGAKITLLEDRAWAVASGQPVVIYIGDRVVGGGYAK